MKTDLLRRAVLAAGAVPLLIAVVSAAAAAPAAAAAATHGRLTMSQPIPLPPKGLRPQAINRPWLDPHAKKWVQALSPAACAALHHQHPGAAPGCRVQDYVAGEKGLPLPAGTHFSATRVASNAAASAPYYEYDYSFVQCNTGVGGCRIWSTNLEIRGVYNGSYVYQWDVWCTPSSNGVTNTCTWRGYSGNGGEYKSGWPVHAMTFGDNSAASGTVAGTTYSWTGGQRVWVDVYGTWFDWTKF